MTDEELATLLRLLESARALDPGSPPYLAAERAAAHLTKSAKKKRRLARSRAARAQDARLIQQVEEAARQPLPSVLAPMTALHHERCCYVCKRPFRKMHASYAWLCSECGDQSQSFQNFPLDLSGRRALLTGGRIKIGLATTLRMLRAGAEVHLTTRFPRDAARRYAAEADAQAWSSRLHVHGLDFRDLKSLLGALAEWSAGPSFDIVINNAAQSVWHPPEWYEALRRGEQQSVLGGTLTEPRGLTLPAPLAQSLEVHDAQRADSWVQKLGDIAAADMVEVQVVNAVAPFLIVNGLRENLKRSAFRDRYVINVTAVEGQFSRPEKTIRHPHTNMAKAGLNMLTRTSASDLRDDSIFMVSVDPGWMSREGRGVAPDFRAPLGAEDCASRVLHPIASGLAGRPLWGVLLKDFVEVPW